MIFVKFTLNLSFNGIFLVELELKELNNWYDQCAFVITLVKQ